MRAAIVLMAPILAAIALAGSPCSTGAQALTAHQQLARDIYKELVEVNTVTGAVALSERRDGEELSKRGAHRERGFLVLSLDSALMSRSAIP